MSHEAVHSTTGQLCQVLMLKRNLSPISYFTWGEGEEEGVPVTPQGLGEKSDAHCTYRQSLHVIVACSAVSSPG